MDGSIINKKPMFRISNFEFYGLSSFTVPSVSQNKSFRKFYFKILVARQFNLDRNIRCSIPSQRPLYMADTICDFNALLRSKMALYDVIVTGPLVVQTWRS